MKILMVQDTFLPKIGGAEVHVWKLSRALRQRGHKVVIVTSVPGDTEVDGLYVYRFPGLISQGKRALIGLPSYLPKMVELLKRHDMVHGHYTAFLSAVFGALASFFGKPFVVTLHGYGTLDSSVKSNKWKRMWRYLSFRYARMVIATSEELGEVARSFAPTSRVIQIPNGVDTSEFSPSINVPPEVPVRIATVRRLVPKNGVQFLIEAIPLILQRSNKPVEFWIIGDGPLRGYMERRVKEVEIGHVVRFWGMLPNQQVRDILEQVHILVFPSSAESTSIAALEAMAMAKPVVASDVGGYPELLGNNDRGILVKLFDEKRSNYDAPLTLPACRLQALADAVVELINDLKKARALGNFAREFVKNYYDWSVIADRIEQVYKQVMK